MKILISKILLFCVIVISKLLAQNNTIIPFEQNDLWGYIDAQTQKVIITPQFKDAYPFFTYHALVKNYENYFFINKEGKNIDDKKYCQIGVLSENLFPFLDQCNNGKWGFLDTKGQILIPAQYSSVSSFREGLANVFDGKRWQYINTRGQKMITLADSINHTTPFENGYAIIGNITFSMSQQMKGKFQIINKQGKIVLDLQKMTQNYHKNLNADKKIIFNQIQEIKDNLAVITAIIEEETQDNNTKIFQALVNVGNGNFIQEPTENKISIISSKLYALQGKENHVYYINNDGKPNIVIQNFQKLGIFQENRLPFANQNGVWGYTDETGKEIIPAKYNFVSPFLNGRSIVREQNNMLIMIDKNGEAINIDKKGRLITHYFDQNTQETIEREIVPVRFAKRFGVINLKNPKIPFGLFAFGLDTLDIQTLSPPLIVKKQKGWNMIYDSEKNILPDFYQYIEPTLQPDYSYNVNDRPFSILKMNEKYAIYHQSGFITSPFAFDKIEVTNYKNIFLAESENTKHLINVVGEKLYSNFDKMLPSKYDDFFILEKQGKVGLVNIYFKEILPFQYEKLEWYDNNNLYVTQNNQLGVFRLSDNQFVLKCEYTKIGNLREKYVIIQKNDKSGLMEKTTQGFQIKLPADYQHIELKKFDNQSYFVVKKNNQIGLLSMDLKVILPCEFQEIKEYPQTYGKPSDLLVKKNDKVGFYQLNGKMKIPCEYEAITNFRSYGNYWALAKKNGLWGAIDSLNNIKIPFEYDSLDNRFPDKKLTSFDVKRKNKWGVINDINQILVPISYDELGHISFDNSLPFGIKVKNKWGYSDKNQKILVKPQYEDAKIPFESTLKDTKTNEPIFIAAVKKNGKWGIIDMKNKKYVSFQYDEVEYDNPKSDFPFRLKKGEKWYSVDLKGNEKE